MEKVGREGEKSCTREVAARNQKSKASGGPDIQGSAQVASLLVERSKSR
jgi:hypothetical protein